MIDPPPPSHAQLPYPPPPQKSTLVRSKGHWRTRWLNTCVEREEGGEESTQSHHAHVEGQGVNLRFCGGHTGHQSGQQAVRGEKNQGPYTVCDEQTAPPPSPPPPPNHFYHLTGEDIGNIGMHEAGIGLFSRPFPF